MRYPCRILIYSYIPNNHNRVSSDISASVHVWDGAREWYSRADWSICDKLSQVYAAYIGTCSLVYETTYREPGRGNTYLAKSNHNGGTAPKKEHLNIKLDGYPKYWEKH